MPAGGGPPRRSLKNATCRGPGLDSRIVHATMRPFSGTLHQAAVRAHLGLVAGRAADREAGAARAAGLRELLGLVRAADLDDPRRGDRGQREQRQAARPGPGGTVFITARSNTIGRSELRASTIVTPMPGRHRSQGTGARVQGRPEGRRRHRPARRGRARSTASSAPTARARRRRSGCSSRCCAPPAAARPSPGFDVATQPHEVRQPHRRRAAGGRARPAHDRHGAHGAAGDAARHRARQGPRPRRRPHPPRRPRAGRRTAASARTRGGMRRRLDLAMALIHEPEVLFLDEPTTGLDPVSRITLWDEVRRLKAEGTTVFLTTQYLEEADQLADRVGIISSGKIVAEGTPGRAEGRGRRPPPRHHARRDDGADDLARAREVVAAVRRPPPGDEGLPPQRRAARAARAASRRSSARSTTPASPSRASSSRSPRSTTSSSRRPAATSRAPTQAPQPEPEPSRPTRRAVTSARASRSRRRALRNALPPPAVPRAARHLPEPVPRGERRRPAAHDRAARASRRSTASSTSSSPRRSRSRCCSAASPPGIATALEIEGGFFDRLVASPIPRVALVVRPPHRRPARSRSSRRCGSSPLGLIFGAEIVGGVPGALLVIAHRGRRRRSRSARIGMLLAFRAKNASIGAGHLPARLRDPVRLERVLPARRCSQPPADWLADYNPLSYIAEGMRDPIICDDQRRHRSLEGFAAGDRRRGVSRSALALAALRGRLREA